MNITVVLPIHRLLTMATTSNILERLDREANMTLLLPFPVTSAIESSFYQYRESRIGRVFRDIVLNSHTMLKSAQVKSFETRIRIILGLHLNFSGDYRLNMREFNPPIKFRAIYRLNNTRCNCSIKVFAAKYCPVIMIDFLLSSPT